MTQPDGAVMDQVLKMEAAPLGVKPTVKKKKNGLKVRMIEKTGHLDRKVH